MKRFMGGHRRRELAAFTVVAMFCVAVGASAGPAAAETGAETDAAPSAVPNAEPAAHLVAQTTAQAEAESKTVAFDIAAQPLAEALTRFGHQSGMQVSADDSAIGGIRANAVSGTLTPAAALRQILQGTGISYRFTGANAVTIVKAEEGAGATVMDPITVEGANPADPGQTEGTRSYAGSQVTVGSKIPTSIREVPQSVSVVTRQRIEDQNLTTLQDAMKQTTGMTVERFDGSGYFNSITARGYTADTYLLDGLPIGANGNLATSLDLAMYDRIEVLRGPAGLFQGAGEPGAAINLVRKRPGRTFAASGAATIGSWKTFRGEGDVSVPIVDSGRIRARVVGVRDDRESFVDIVETKKSFLYGTVEADLTKDTILAVGGAYQDIDTVMDQGLPAYADGRLADVRRSTFTGANWNRQDLHSAESFAELTHTLPGGGRLQGSLRYLYRDMFYRVARAWDAIDPVTGDFPVETVEFGFNRRTWTADVHGTTPFVIGGLTQNVLLGFDYRKYHNTRTDLAFGPDFTSNIFDPVNDLPEPDFAPSPDVDSDQLQFGAYGQLRIKPIDWGTLVLGGRVSWWRQNSFGSQRSVSAKFTPYAGVVVDLSNQFSAYGSYASIFQPQSAQTVDGAFLPPRTGDQYEIGVKGEFLDGRIQSHLAAFRIDDKNRALPDPDNPGFSIAAGEVRSQGIESEISGNPLPGLDIVVGYAYTTTEYITAAVTDQGNTFATFTPKHIFNLWSKYTFLGGAVEGLSFGGGVKYVSRFYSEDDGVEFAQDGYATVAAQVGYRLSDHWAGTFTVTNLLDEKYYEKVGFAGRQNFYGEPRAYMLTVRATW